MAETADAAAPTATAFACNLASFRVYFDALTSAMGVTPVWTVAEDGLSATADMDVVGVVSLTLDAESMVTAVTSETSIAIANLSEGGFYFGTVVALATISAKAAEDETFMMDQNNLAQLETDLGTLINAVLEHTNEAMLGIVSDTSVIAGHPCTVSLSIDSEKLTLNMGFAYLP